MRDIVSPLAGFSSPFGRGADPYAILGYRPPLVLDYENSKFRVSGSTSTAPSVVTATRTGLATQLDASGNLVWNAHNLLTYSEDFTNAAWGKIRCDVSAEDSDGFFKTTTNEATFDGSISQNIAASANTNYTVSIEAKAAERDFLFIRERISSASSLDSYFNLTSGTVATTAPSHTARIEEVESGVYRCSITFTTDGTARTNSVQFFNSADDNNTTSSEAGDGIFLRRAHLYRSDLGGMAPVPLTRRVAGSTTYVPTTSAAVYLPREEAYTYVSGSLVGPYYQKESDARTNLVTYSEDFTNVAWSKQRVTVSADATISPDGTANATKLIEDSTAGNSHYLFLDTANTATSTTISIFAKSAERSVIWLYEPSTAVGKLFNLADGTVGSDVLGTPVDAQIEDFGNGWYRCSITTTASTQFWVGVAQSSSGPITTNGDGASGVYIYGAQLEAGSTPSSHIPTSGSTVTRSADSTTISAGNMPAYTNALSFQMDGLTTGESSTFANWTLDANNGIQITSGASDFTFTQEAAGVVDSVTGGTYSPGINVPFNIASRHGSTFINGAVDGTALTADLTPTALPDLSATDFDLAPTFNGFIKEFRVWGADIGDTGIAEAST